MSVADNIPLGGCFLLDTLVIGFRWDVFDYPRSVLSMASPSAEALPGIQCHHRHIPDQFGNL